ncbi:MAG: NAD(P)/FAD-dependent oxidoreductase [Bryobacteraceae bacterium]
MNNNPITEAPGSSQKRVVIVGGGFAGLHAAKGLSHLPLEVVVVDRRNHHTFQPLLYQVALAVLSPADIAQPIRGVLSGQKNLQVVMDEVVGGDLADSTVQLKSGLSLHFDYLCLATGSTHSYFGRDEWAPLAPGLKTLEDATEIRRRILLAFELAERQAIETGKHPPLNFVVVGGGPTGVELAGAISDISQAMLKEDYRHIKREKVRIILYEGLPRLLNSYPEDLTKSAEKQLRDLGVEVYTNSRVEDVQPGYLVVNKERVDAVVMLWGAGVQASPLGRTLGLPVDNKGCVLVDESLNPAGYKNIFVLGDLAHVEENGTRVPGVAQPAMQMGDFAARTIGDDLAGRPRKRFHYFDKGDMATIGRHAAVANLKWPFHAHWSGYFAWLAWALVHVYFLIGFRNRLLVLLQWAWTYFFYSRSARLITGNQTLVGWNESVGDDEKARTTAAV